MSHFLCQEESQEDQENMQEMDILDMNVLDETENDNGIPAEDDENDAEYLQGDDDDEVVNEKNDIKALESEDEAKAPEVKRDERLIHSFLFYTWESFNVAVLVWNSADGGRVWGVGQRWIDDMRINHYGMYFYNLKLVI